MSSPLLLIFAFLGGILPALVWLFFWLKEDENHPEPKKLIFLTFLYGMLVVPIAFIIESLIDKVLPSGILVDSISENVVIAGGSSIISLLLWSLTEEVLKYFAARNGGLRRKANDEPIDPIIYLITAGLGFAAGENILFMIEPLFNQNFTEAFVLGNMRFVGSTLLHIVTSAVIGIFLSFSYFKNNKVKKSYLITGITLATLLHLAFNLFIINSDISILLTFSIVWIAIIVLILIFEKVKKIHLNKIE